MMLIASKVDLREDEVTILRMKRLKNQKPVSTKEGEAMAKRIGAVSYHEYSANLQETIPPICDKILEIYLDPPPRAYGDESCNVL